MKVLDLYNDYEIVGEFRKSQQKYFLNFERKKGYEEASLIIDKWLIK